MQTLGQAIRERRRALGLTLQQVADCAMCAKSYVSLIENDKRDAPPSEELLGRLERVLRVEEGALVRLARWKSTPAEIRKELEEMTRANSAATTLARLCKERTLDEAYRSGELEEIVGRMSRGDRMTLLPLPVQVPVINKVAAGYPAQFTDLDYPAQVADEYVSAPDVVDPQAFAARVVGDSMEPAYREGDIVVFSPDKDTAPGSDCFVRLERDAETTFKRVYFERDDEGREMIRLQPLNSAYAPRVLRRESVAGLYAAVYVIRPVGG